MSHATKTKRFVSFPLAVTCWAGAASAQTPEADILSPAILPSNISSVEDYRNDGISTADENAGKNSFFDVSANISFVTDYRYRGISLTSLDPALQGGVDVNTASGIFAGAWASTVSDTSGSNTEIDIYGGYANSFSGFDYSVSVYGYVYPGGEDVNYFEFWSTAGRTIGPVALQLQFAYTPDQGNYGYDNLYLKTLSDIALPGTPLTVNLELGWERNRFFEKWDWSAGLSWSHDLVTISASYVDTTYGEADEAGRLGGAGFRGALSVEF